MRKKLLQVLPLYVPPEPLRTLAEAAEVVSITLHRETKIMELAVQFDRLVPPEELVSLSSGIASTYKLAEARVFDVLPAHLLTKTAVSYLVEETVARFPSAAGFFSGCMPEVSPDAKTVTITLADGGKDIVEGLGCVTFMQNRLRERFSLPVQVILREAEEANPQDKLDQYVAMVEKELAAQAPPPSEPAPTERKAPEPAPAPAPAPAPQAKPADKPFFRRPKAPKPDNVPEENVILGKPFGEPSLPMNELTLESGRVAVCGEVFALEAKPVRDGTMTVISADITDKKGSVRIKRVMDTAKANFILEKLKKGAYVRVRGDMEYDRFADDIILKPLDIYLAEKPAGRMDKAEKKRVELHLHTNMSAMDGVSSPTALIQQAIAWGQPAIAITDHGVTQAFPEAMHAAGGKIKIIYGLEGYFVNNADDMGAVRGRQDGDLDGEFVCFDIETTGTDTRTDGITEIAAVIVRNGEIVDTFHTYTNPGRPISAFITELTGITNDMVQNAPSNAEAVAAFRAFCGNRIVVAHNASFDTGFVQAVSEAAGEPWELTYIDTLALARVLMPDQARHKLNLVAEALGLPQFRHHSALEDTKTLALIFIRFVKMLMDRGAKRVSDIGEALASVTREATGQGGGLQNLPVRHILLLVQNTTGLKNLYKLVSMSHIKYMNRRKQPIIPKSELIKHREGILVGSACEAGELFRAILEGRDMKELRQIARFYDFLEIQPLGNNEFLTRGNPPYTKEDLINFNKTIVKLGQELNIPVVATGDVHFKEPEDELFRRILMNAKGFEDADNQAPLYMRTTEEMLAEFSYLGEKKAYEVVVENTNRIADQIESIKPVPDGMFPPELPGSAEELQQLTYSKAHEMYGDPLPKIVAERIEKELGSIIKHGFDVMYMIAQKLIKRSNEHGYVVGSRGSVGSSVVAFFSGITEINALPPHYRCPNCRHSDFDVADLADCGLDLPDRACPVCGEKLEKDGFNIPFETFLGFDGDKAPDIDLNFSGEYQALAHKHTIEMFGEENVFRAGTIGTVAEKTAYGYVKKYNEERGIVVSKAEEYRQVLGCTGVKRTTGQHPGGLIVVPRHKEIYDFCPVQRPADDLDTDIITTHVDYHSIDANLLKLDLLGKDDPTILRYLEDQTGVKADKVPLHDPNVLELFNSNKPLGIEPDEITGPNGALGIPEYGTSFVRQMLVDTQPRTVADLVRISGLSHGTDVWLNNAKDLILEEGLTLRDCICCRDDIMDYLIKKGLEPKLSFTIMEAVRKGKKLKPEWEEIMREKGVPEWYIGSCNKIAYMFPKAHAAAYVVMALRIAWFKVYEPLAYYSSFFSIKAKAFDPDAMLAGDAAVCKRMAEIKAKKDATAIEEELVRTLEIAHEYLKRGFKFLPVDLYKSDADKFVICKEENALRLPFAVLPGLGGIAAKELAAEREKGPFISKEDLTRRCPKVNSACVAALEAAGALAGLAETNQMTLFEF